MYYDIDTFHELLPRNTTMVKLILSAKFRLLRFIPISSELQNSVNYFC